MPNYCDNTFKVKGKMDDINRFLEESTSMNVGYLSNKTGNYTIEMFLDFEKIHPTPKKRDGEDIDNWYDWRIKNWGTKWNVCDTYHFTLRATEDNQVELTTTFSTAWTPADKLYKHLFKKYKDTSLEFYVDYYEGGCAFAGETRAKNGQIIEERYHEYRKDDEEEKLKYYAYLIEKDFESNEWLEDQIYEHMEMDDIEEEIIDQTIAEFNTYFRRNNFEKAAELFLSKVNY